jgi:hypothetical protein
MWGQNPLSYYILYNESKHNILALVGKTSKASCFVFSHIWLNCLMHDGNSTHATL